MIWSTSYRAKTVRSAVRCAIVPGLPDTAAVRPTIAIRVEAVATDATIINRADRMAADSAIAAFLRAAVVVAAVRDRAVEAAAMAMATAMVISNRSVMCAINSVATNSLSENAANETIIAIAAVMAGIWRATAIFRLTNSVRPFGSEERALSAARRAIWRGTVRRKAAEAVEVAEAEEDNAGVGEDEMLDAVAEDGRRTVGVGVRAGVAVGAAVEARAGRAGAIADRGAERATAAVRAGAEAKAVGERTMRWMPNRKTRRLIARNELQSEC